MTLKTTTKTSKNRKLSTKVREESVEAIKTVVCLKYTYHNLFRFTITCPVNSILI